MIKFFAGAVAVLLMAGLGSTVQASGSSSALMNSATRFCTTMDDAMTHGSIARQTTCDGSDTQLWYAQVIAFEMQSTSTGLRQGAPIVRFINVRSGLCLDNPNGPNAGVVQSTCNGATSQQWEIDSPQQGTLGAGVNVVVQRHVLNKANGYCLSGDLYAANGLKMNTVSCASLAEQDWLVDVF